jgi:dTDP-4-amino-4,6-dideoxygalactose transaminase
MNIPIVRPHHPRFSEFETEFKVALKTGVVTNNGMYVQEFEKQLTKHLDVPAICFNNGMSALIAMLRAVDIQGMDVICPAFTFAATPHAIIMAGGRPIFCDINQDTLCLDHEDAERRITGRTTAIMGVDPYGLCWEPPEFWKDGDIDILIDSAPSFGSDIVGKNPATRGKAQVYSFHATKPFSTMEGGCLCSEDEGLIARAKAIRNFGIGENGKVEQIGINGKMTEICAIIGLKQLESWPERILNRLDGAAVIHDALGDIKGLHRVLPPSNQMPIWTYYPVLIEQSFGVPRNIVVKKLHERGIMVRQYYEPCHKQPAYMLNPKFPSGHVPLKVTEHVAEQVIALPVFDEMEEAESNQIATAFKEIQKEAS